MHFSLPDALHILQRTPTVLESLLAHLPDAWTLPNDGPDTWSAFDVVGHLLHGEQTDWVVRAKIILSDQADKTFEPFDRFAQLETSKGKTMEQLLQAFRQQRMANLEWLRAQHLTETHLDLTGTHPALGQATLRQLLSTWVVHDLNHLAQISRVMARQYEQEVGPWKVFLGILR